ncbi:oligosaccharide deacetylase [Paenibacillus sp. CCS19]|uniref:polysaccharide deacetylase family protein n=1 Tax=Paenibacillus sp. CCS19 TaxID=3158387 RepID=UPI002563EA6A|nr:polysaccharide deacetylase family protein [Paenibacillus cellulosilyticus]GMK37053.1 oligosaccharide deacetylase [Paenibacillus cellulosilyticus]
MTKATMYNEVATKEKLVAFTFDDGPNPEWTPLFLDVFRKHGAKATFFFIGSHIDKYPELAKKTFEEGHELGNHTFSHPFMSKLSKEEQVEELSRADRMISGVTGRNPSTCRPPYFDVNDDLLEACAERGYSVIGAANMESRDWEDATSAEHIIATSREQIRNGSIFIYHDGFGDRSSTLKAVSILIPELIEAGYRLVTISELLASRDDA